MAIGLCLGCCATAACCAGSACCSGLCKCFECCGVRPKSNARLGYVLLQLFWVLLSFSLMYTLKPAAENIDFVECVRASGQAEMSRDAAVESVRTNDREALEAGSGDACFGVSAVLRMTFALFLFHVFILLLISPRGDCAAVIHDGGWALKFILVGGAFTAFFWIPISFFQTWAEISRYASILFLIIQVLYVLIGAIAFNDYLVNRPTDDDPWKHTFLLIYTIFLTVCSIVLIVFAFIWFLGGGDDTDVDDEAMEEDGVCGLNLAVLIITCVMFIVVFVLRLRPDSSLFTSAMVNAWLCYLAWSALASQPDGYCNTLIGSPAATFFQIFS